MRGGKTTASSSTSRPRTGKKRDGSASRGGGGGGGSGGVNDSGGGSGGSGGGARSEKEGDWRGKVEVVTRMSCTLLPGDLSLYQEVKTVGGTKHDRWMHAMDMDGARVCVKWG